MIKAKKRKDGRYATQIVTGYKNGKPARKTIYGKTLKELDKKYREFKEQQESGTLLSNQDMKFSELSELWMINTKKGVLRTQSYNNLASQIKGLNAFIGDLLVKDLTKSHFEQIRAQLLEEGKIDKYNKALSNGRAILDYAIDSNIILRNPTSGMHRIANKAQKRTLTEQERALLQKADLNDFERCFTSLLLYTGMRRSEALALNISDIDFKKMQITVSKTLVLSEGAHSQNLVQQTTKTKAGCRTLPIPSPLYPILKTYCKDRIGILFTSNTGNRIGVSTFTKRWKSLLKKLEEANGGPIAKDITPHIFRHTYASDLYKAGIDIKSAQYLLGHDDIKTTLDTYTHFGYADVKIDNLEAYYSRHAVKMQSEKKEIPGNA